LAHDERYLSRKDVAAKLGISIWAWDDLVSHEGAPAPIIIANKPKMKRWKASEIEAWVEKHPREMEKAVADTKVQDPEEEDTIHDEDNPVVDR